MTFKEFKVCSRCVMDTTDPDIQFDEKSSCNHCRQAKIILDGYSLPIEKKEEQLQKIINEIRKNGRSKKYDCIIGVSGGVDSTFLAYKVKEFGLRPLAIHVDNGWNSELSVSNIRDILNNLGIELYTYVLDWEEFRDLQVAFLKASTPDSEIPTDHAILSVLRKFSLKENVPVIAGTNYTGESIMPKAWAQGYNDWAYIKKVSRQFGSGRLKTFPHMNYLDLFYFNRIKRQSIISLLNYLDYNRDEAKKFLMNALKWKDYGGKHHESIYTKFFQSYILPTKFNIDKRKAHFSSMIVAGYMTREQAVEELKNPIYNPRELKADMEYVIKKLNLSQDKFNVIMSSLPAKYEDISPVFTRCLFQAEKRFFKLVFLSIKRIRKITNKPN